MIGLKSADLAGQLEVLLFVLIRYVEGFGSTEHLAREREREGIRERETKMNKMQISRRHRKMYLFGGAPPRP